MLWQANITDYRQWYSLPSETMRKLGGGHLLREYDNMLCNIVQVLHSYVCSIIDNRHIGSFSGL
jgi:hypothetical protein